MKTSMKASSIQKLLTLLIVILILVVGGGFYLGVQQVKSVAVGVNHTAADAEASAENVEKLAELKRTLAQSETLVSKANKLFASDTTYQSQALKDVQKYANESGLTISNTNFDTAAADTSGAFTTPGKTFAITLQTPVSYKGLLRFLDAIEGSLPKMQVSSIRLAHPTTKGADNVVVGDITITVSTR